MSELGFPLPGFPNPFLPRREQERPESRYSNVVNRLTARFTYDEGKLNPDDIEKVFGAARRQSGTSEGERQKLETLQHLFQGIEAQERADRYFNGPWQQMLAEHRYAKSPKRPERLTREEVARALETFTERNGMQAAEKRALEEYLLALERTSEDVVARPSENTTVTRTDIEVLIIDLRNRLAERLPDAEKRREALNALDDELKAIIDRLSDEDWGKRLELEEVYLLRRMIHAADTGHIASVRHGSPREDLRQDMGSVDLEITAAGDVFPFQIKTFKRTAGYDSKGRQYEIGRGSRAKLAGSSTRFAVLETEAVQNAYAAALRRDTHAAITLTDKYAAIKPITDEVRPEERRRLLTVMGLTEEQLEREKEEMAKKQAARLELEDVLQRKREEEEQFAAKSDARLQQERETREVAAAEEEARLAAIAAREEEIRATARKEFEGVISSRRAKQEAAHAHIEETSRRENERRIEREREEQARAAKEAAAEARMQKRKEKIVVDWPPKNLAGLSNSTLFIKMGLLPADWKNDAPALLGAKKRFVQLFSKPKRGATVSTEQDKPNDMFARAFPSKTSLESPTPEDIARWRGLGV